MEIKLAHDLSEFVQVVENLESHGIYDHFNFQEDHGKAVCFESEN